MKITKRQLRRIIKEAQWGNFTGGAASLDVPMRDSDPVPKDQLRKMADIFINDMGMSPEEVLAKPEFVEQGITDLRQLDESKIKITKRQLRKLIQEAIDFVNRETGEVIDFGEDSISGVPDAAVPDLSRRLGIDLSQEVLSPEDWQKLDDEVLGKQSDREVRKRISKFKEDEARLNPDNLLSRLQNWAHDAFEDYAGDNPDTDIQDVAFDLADAARYEFEQDEWDELLWHFDGDADALKVYAAESMG